MMWKMRGAVLAADPFHRAHVLADVVPGVGVVEVGDRRRRDDEPSGDVVEPVDHLAVQRPAVRLRGVQVRVVGADHPTLVDRGVGLRGFPPGSAHLRPHGDRGQLVAHVGDTRDAVHVRDRQGQAHDQLGPVGLVGDGSGPLPHAERAGEVAGGLDLTGQEDALPGTNTWSNTTTASKTACLRLTG